MAAHRQAVGIEHGLRSVEERAAHFAAGRLAAIGHAVAQSLDRRCQFAQHRQYVRIAELDVLVDRGVAREDAPGHGQVQLVTDGAQRM